MSTQLWSILVLGGLGCIFGVGLALASRIFRIKQNPLKLQIMDMLPKANCGACGFAGCEAYADWLVSDQKASVDKCTVGGPETTRDIGRLFGKEVIVTGQKIAVIMCSGGKDCTDRFSYQGISTCEAVNLVFGGHKSCLYGCLGFGDCVKVCPFDAITLTISGTVPVINTGKCTGCGLCVTACPKKIIELVEDKFKVGISCKSRDKGALVRKICKTGCIGCGICVKVCPVNDIVLENNLARIKHENCNNCGICVEKCPTKTIRSRTGVPPVNCPLSLRGRSPAAAIPS
ncbi:MAG: RnfABCDGE type electron transport complex subunit B [Candidatus Omnitrophota bacterium]